MSATKLAKTELKTSRWQAILERDLVVALASNPKLVTGGPNEAPKIVKLARAIVREFEVASDEAKSQ